MRSFPTLSCLLLASLASLASLLAGQDEASPFRKDQVKNLSWRHLGPTNMAGRITDFEAVPGRIGHWYVASASGGLFKTENAGTTWKHLFTQQGTVSIGDVAVAPSQPEIVWVGTGEENGRNSVSWGDGVYKSKDGGKTFKRVGLEKSFQIGHIAIHPKEQDIVFVAALGQLWGQNEERGLYRSLDGGKSWEKVLYLDDKTGCIDVRIDPGNPEIVYAAMYERLRDQFDGNDPLVRFGEKAGLFRSDDGGQSFKRLGGDLPTCNWGRSAICLYPKQPGTLFALIETERSGWASGVQKTRAEGGGAYMGARINDAEDGALLSEIVEDSPAAKAGFKKGDIVQMVDALSIESYRDMSDTIDEHRSGDKVKVAVLRGKDKVNLDLTFGKPPSRRGRAPYYPRLGGQRGNVQGRQGDRGWETGGVFRSDDYGETWKRLNSLIPRPFYFCVFTVDPENDQNIYVCGIQFWQSKNGGERFTQANRGIHVDFHAVWVDPKDSDHVIACSDGGLNVSFDGCKSWELVNNFCMAQFYHVATDQAQPYNVYGGLQDNGTWGGPSRTRFSDGLGNDDWFKIYSGDGFGAAIDPEDPNVVFATGQLGRLGRVNLKTGSQNGVQKARSVDGTRTRFNWDTPFFISPHNPRIFYFAGNFAFRSLNRGTKSEPISKQLGLTDRGTATAFAESSRQAGLLYVGCDDGAIWCSKNGGHDWEELHAKIEGMPGPRYVSSIQPSHHSTKRVYLTMDGHRSNDFDTYVFVSSNNGETWTSLRANLPKEPVHVLCEDQKNQNLLFLGTEFAAYASLDRGKQWFKLGSGINTVAVRDLVIQNRESELVAATHGSGIFVLDIEPLRQLSSRTAEKKAHLFTPQRSIAWQRLSRSKYGQKQWRAPRAPKGPSIYLWLKDPPEKAPAASIKDLMGKELMRLKGNKIAGIQKLALSRSTSSRGSGGRSGRRSGRPAGSRRRGGRSRGLPPSQYRVHFKLGEDKEQVQALTILPDPLMAREGMATHPRSRN